MSIRIGVRGRLALLGAVVACAGAGTVVAVADDENERGDAIRNLEAIAAQEAAAEKPTEYVLTRAAGMDPASAKPVSTTARGRAARAVSDGKTSCLIFSDGIDNCATSDEISAGRSLNVVNSCGAGADRRVDITGFVPSSVATVQLVYSDGSKDASPVREGAFSIGAQTPIGDEPLPVSVEWIGKDGQPIERHAFPLGKGGFCPGS